MSAAEVDRIFARGEVGDIPDGDAEGTAIVWPGSKTEGLSQSVIRHVAWRGKVFHAREGWLKNRILPLGLPAIAADVYRDRSWFDGGECIAELGVFGPTISGKKCLRLLQL
ncbi:MAG: hypothetical protein ACPGUV_14880, partial [Polyangiales bacterium]